MKNEELAPSPGPIGAMLSRLAEERGTCAAFEFGERVTSYAQLHANSDAAARALLAGGCRPGARIGYLGKNNDRYFELLCAAAKAGMVIVPIGWRLTAPEIAFLIADAEVDLLFVEPAFHPIALAASEEAAPNIISVEQAVAEAPGYEEWRATGIAGAMVLPVVNPDEPVLQLYTSGTTGKPKGAMISHHNIYALRPICAAAGLGWDQWQVDDVSLVTMPVAHISGSGWGLVGLYNGAKSIVLPEFDAAAILHAVTTENISRIFLVPAAIQAVLRHPDAAKSDFSRLRYILYGASPIPLDLLREAIEVFGCGFVQNYGMTETCGTVVALPPEDHTVDGSQRMASAGRALPGVTLRVVDERLEAVPAGTTGEILIHSPTTMVGYWRRPKATAEALIDGWMRTGDAGYLDADGYLFVQDRLKDMIISGGENVYPAEVESALYAHPDVAEVAVIGVPDERWGEAVTAVVVPNGGTIDSGALLLWARERLASYKVPKRVIVRESLPRNASGKVLRRELREPFWAGRERGIN
ncbi:long-chain-fatty-acid--CoA ligase [Novosphingobium cyanobacteriorum]|uniref:Long-chain-fatty-acid--CoA ligase n=1 Tax=Novosphingobium cyanobacteriorum TaxID=3024215 RepID=A0ABT6CP27_9SPHN|nr:long-chain-fatty-acid--CoA ligase [Novosphingobium cyanobacteriorum]MDF8335669.1 long-chain-fatty-acid--CoA ligase [Novosphingobium cyanobacteriorum]